MTAFAFLLLSQLPPWIEAAHTQPVEIHAQLIPAIARQLQIIQSLEFQTLRDRALTARHWLPRFPALQSIPAGYAAYLDTVDRPVSGLGILVSALLYGAIPSAAERRRILEELPVRSPAQPTCTDPVVEWLAPLFDRLSADAPYLYPDRESKLAALERWATWVESPFDLLGFVGFARNLKFEAPEDQARAAGLISAILSRASAPPCGMSFLLRPVNLRGAVTQAIEAFGHAPITLVAYRQFVTRVLSAPVCRSTPEEVELRRQLAGDFNAKLQRWPIEGVSPLGESEIVRLQGESRQLDGSPPSFDEPANCAKARKALQVQPTEESWADFVAAWDAWSSEQLGGDLRHEDSKLSTLLQLELPASYQPRLTAKTLEALSTSRLKSEEPGLWASMVLSWLQRTKPRGLIQAAPADPALALLWALVTGRL